MAKSDNRKNFTQKQLHALPFIATCQTYTLAAEKAEVTYKQICEWMLQKPFKAEVRRLQDEVLENAVASLKTATTKAVDVLIVLLDDEESRTRYSISGISLFKHGITGGWNFPSIRV